MVKKSSGHSPAVIFVPVTAAHLPVLSAWFDAPAVRSRIAVDDFDAYYRTVSKQENYYLYSVFDGEALVALVMAEILENRAAAALIVDPARTGHGIGTNTLLALTANAHTLFGEVASIDACIEPDHTASIRCFENGGFTCVGTDEYGLYIYRHECRQRG